RLSSRRGYISTRLRGLGLLSLFFFSSRRRHTRWPRDWSSDVCSSDLGRVGGAPSRDDGSLIDPRGYFGIKGSRRGPYSTQSDQPLGQDRASSVCAVAKSSGVSTSVSAAPGQSTYTASARCACTTALPHPSPLQASSSPNKARRNSSGGAVTSPYRDTTSGTSVPRAAATRPPSICSVTSTMSPSITTAATTSGPSRSRPLCNDPLVGPVKSGFTTDWHARPFSSALARSTSWPSTTITGESPAATARRAARRSSDSPSSWSSILLRPAPMRRDAPAARITPATRGRSVWRGMDRGGTLTQRVGPPPGPHGQHLGDHRKRYLLGAVGADVETDGPEDPRFIDRPGRAQAANDAHDPLGALAGP